MLNCLNVTASWLQINRITLINWFKIVKILSKMIQRCKMMTINSRIIRYCLHLESGNLVIFYKIYLNKSRKTETHKQLIYLN